MPSGLCRGGSVAGPPLTGGVAVMVMSTIVRACHAVWATKGSPDTVTCLPTSGFSATPWPEASWISVTGCSSMPTTHRGASSRRMKGWVLPRPGCWKAWSTKTRPSSAVRWPPPSASTSTQPVAVGTLTPVAATATRGAVATAGARATGAEGAEAEGAGASCPHASAAQAMKVLSERDGFISETGGLWRRSKGADRFPW